MTCLPARTTAPVFFNPEPRHCSAWLPPDDLERAALHNEVHARPAARIRLPALITYVAVINQGVTREMECAHLRLLEGQQELPLDSLSGNFLRLRFNGYTVKWERHSEFTRYSIVQALPAEAGLEAIEPYLLDKPVVPRAWLANIPGRTLATVQLVMTHGHFSEESALMANAQRWFGGRTLVASQLGYVQGEPVVPGPSSGHSWALTDFRIDADGFERMLVIAQPGITETRTGRISQRLLELETYRMMALRGLPIAKLLSPMLTDAESALAAITALLENKSVSDQKLLETLILLAARVERAMAEHNYRFSATHAYDALVGQRIAELREKAIPGTQTIGEFLQRRLSPAMATVAATAHRLSSLSERVSRTNSLLRTRVDIATELQNQQLLEKLTRGQALQLRLQSTVEGLSIAAISYYVISLLLYASKALKAAGVPVNSEIAVGLLIPVVLGACGTPPGGFMQNSTKNSMQYAERQR